MGEGLWTRGIFNGWGRGSGLEGYSMGGGGVEVDQPLYLSIQLCFFPLSQ